MLNFTPCANFIQIFSHLGCEEGVLGGAQTNAEDAAERPVGQLVAFLILQFYYLHWHRFILITFAQ